MRVTGFNKEGEIIKELVLVGEGEEELEDKFFLMCKRYKIDLENLAFITINYTNPKK